MKVQNYLFETNEKHLDMVDSYAYMIAAQYLKLKDDYFFLYIKRKPRWMPMFIYKWFISNFIVTVNFK